MGSTETNFDRIECDRSVLDGQPCIRGTRLTVKRVVLAVAELRTPEALEAGYPQLDEEAIAQALTYAAASLDGVVIPLKSAS